MSEREDTPQAAEAPAGAAQEARAQMGEARSAGGGAQQVVPADAAQAARAQMGEARSAGGGAQQGDAWAQVRAAALLGTGRRPVEGAPVAAGVPVGDRVGGVAGVLGAGEARLLDLAALGGAARRAGLRPTRLTAPPPPAPTDDRPAAPTPAAQLLDVLLGPAPLAAAPREELVALWCTTCGESGYRLPESSLVALLTAATGRRRLRPAAVAVLGARGMWLAAANPDWSWAAEAAAGAGPPRDPQDWARRPAAERVGVLADLRSTDPAAARDLIEATWARDPATARRDHLAVLAESLGPADEPLVESALDDRAVSVRQVAAGLLDGLPHSARAGRMARRLEPLITATGRLRANLVVARPEPTAVAWNDDAARRDGLAPPARRTGAASRDRRLEDAVAGAPFDLWTGATGGEPQRVVALLADSDEPTAADVLAGLRRAARARHDGEWATALFRAGRAADPLLLAAVGPERREALVAERLSRRPRAVELAALLDHLAAPWSLPFSLALLGHVRGHDHPATPLAALADVLTVGLHPDALPAVEGWLEDERPPPVISLPLRTVLQVHALRRSITEAFA
jgi:hypothetical protein